MTTIMYDRQAGIMAADSRAYSGRTTPIGEKRKIFRLGDGALVGVSSTVVGFSTMFLPWLEAGADPLAAPNYLRPIDRGDATFDALMVSPKGDVFMFINQWVETGPLDGDVFAIGTGAEYALGAFWAGGGIGMAMRIACELDIWSAPPIVTLAREPGR